MTEEKTLKVIILALSVNNAMGQILSVLMDVIAKHVNVCLIAPDVFDYKNSDVTLKLLNLGKNKRMRLLRMLNPFYIFKLLMIIKHKKPQVIHIFNAEGYPLSIIASVIAKIFRVPLLVSVHDVEPHGGSKIDWINSKLKWITIRNSTALQVFNRESTEVMQAFNKRIYFIPLWDISSIYSKYKHNNIIRETGTVLFFGRLEYYKGIDILVRAILKIPNLKLLIAGSGSLDDKIRAMIAISPDQFELYENYVADSEVAILFQRATVCVLPYRHVTQSVVPLISAAFGVPVIASCLGDFKCMVPQIGGRLIEPESVDDIVDALSSMHTVLVKYCSKYKVENAVKAYESIYNEIA